MMRILVLSVLFLATAIDSAAADCKNNQVAGKAFDSLLTNKLVCGRPGDGYTGSKND